MAFLYEIRVYLCVGLYLLYNKDHPYLSKVFYDKVFQCL